MDFERKYQSLIIQEDYRRRQKRRRAKDKKKLLSQGLKGKMQDYLVVFLDTSSIHGLKHLILDSRHPCEVFLWFAMLVISVVCAAYISATTWIRYQSSPTVISMERDMYAWNTTFPAITLCPNEKIDPVMLENYVQSSNVTDKDKLKSFINLLANANFKNFNEVPEYDEIAPEQYLELILNLSSQFKATMEYSTASVPVVPTITEIGVCYAVLSQVAVYNSPEYRKANRWDIIDSKNSILFVHPLDGSVYGLGNLSHAYTVYAHGPFEVPDITSKGYHSPVYQFLRITFAVTSVYTTPKAASLSVDQRHCRFEYDNNLKHNSVYTYTMCRMECRIQLCLKYCDCIPYFYRTVGDEKICDVKGLHCLHHHAAQIVDVKGIKKPHCECLHLCDDVNYVLQSHNILDWVAGKTSLYWGIETFPRMRYKRDVIFGFTDVLVAVGGMAGLFFGCSVLGFVEIVYFLSLRLVCYTALKH